MSIVPPAAPRVMPRLVSSDVVAPDHRRAPPSSVIELATGFGDGAGPNAAVLLLMVNVPPKPLSPPAKVLLELVSTSSPGPVLLSLALDTVPLITPLMVTVPVALLTSIVPLLLP